MLTVRVGIFTRTENIRMYDTWVLAGVSSSACH